MGLKIGISGVGQFGPQFVPLFQAHPEVDEVVLADLFPDRLAKVAANLIQRCRAPLILDGVVEQGGNGLVFASAVFQRQAGYSQQVCDVGYICPLAALPGVQLRRQDQGLFKTGRERHIAPRYLPKVAHQACL